MIVEQGSVRTRQPAQIEVGRGVVTRSLLLARRLFHAAIGLTFLVLAVASGWFCYTEWQTYRLTPSSLLKYFIILSIGFTVLLVIFGLYSFVKARSVRFSGDYPSRQNCDGGHGG